MKNYLYTFMLLTLTSFAFAESAISVTIVHGVIPNPPFHFGDQPHHLPGITVEVLQRLEQRLDLELHFKAMPWVRALQEVANNTADGIFHTSFKKNRMEMGMFPMKDCKPDPSRQLMNQSYFLYKRGDSPLQWNGTTFSHLKGPIGTVLGYAIADDLRRMDVQLEETLSQWSNLQMLAAGRIEGIAGLETMNDIHIKAYPDKFRNVIKVYPPIQNKPYYLMLSHQFVKKHPELSERIWDEIRHIHQTGEYDRIAEKYLK